MLRTKSILGSFALFASVAATACSSSSGDNGNGNPSTTGNEDAGSSGGAGSSGSGSDAGSSGSDSGSAEEASTGSDSGGGACAPYVSAANLTTPTVSFATDVQPLLQRSCGIGGSTCHGSQNGEEEGLYLAEPSINMDGYGNPATIIAGIVGVKSVEDPPMNIVTASDPEHSFLMHKIDDSQCAITAECQAPSTLDAGVVPPCGAPMPYLSSMLDTSDRDTIRRWIAQGAKNN